jgi:hypothetical protein
MSAYGLESWVSRRRKHEGSPLKVVDDVQTTRAPFFFCRETAIVASAVSLFPEVYAASGGRHSFHSNSRERSPKFNGQHWFRVTNEDTNINKVTIASEK